VKILVLTPNLPYPLNNGGLIRVYHLIVNLGKEHDITVICKEPDNEKQTYGLNVLRNAGITIETVPIAINQKAHLKRFYQLLSLFSKRPYQFKQYYSTAMQKKIDKHLKEYSYDALLVEFSQMGYYTLDTDIPSLVDQHNVEYEIMRRTYETEQNWLRKYLAYNEWKKYHHQEIENCKKFSACVTTSRRDAEILQERAPELHCHVVPNGVDSTFFTPNEASGSPVEDGNMILFTGTISYYPNVEGILWFYKSIWPLIIEKRPQTVFCIAGKSPSAEVQAIADTDESVIVTGLVDDMRDYYNRASVVVVPLRVGGGTRLKILEAMSMSKAIVSTSIGAEGIEHTNGTNISIKSSPQEFSDAVVEILNDSVLRKELGRNARDLIDAKYDWVAVGEKLSGIFEQATRDKA